MKNKYSPDLLFLTAIVGFAIGVKFFYARSSTEDLLIFLQPVSWLVEFFTGSAAVYSPEDGFLFSQLHINIERSCSGVNFFVMAFCMVAISTLPFYYTIKKKIIALFCWTVLAYLLTIGATSSRILIAVNSLQLQDLYPWLAGGSVHQLQGGFVYLFFLILFYLSATYFNTKISKSYA